MSTILNVDQNILIVSVVALFTVPIFCYIWINSMFQNVKLPPGPRGLPIVGYLPYLDPDLHLQLTQMSKTYGPIYKLWLGRKLVVVLNSPSLVKQVVRDHDVIFANRDAPMSGLAITYGGKDIVWSPFSSTTWRVLRKVFVREMMSNSALDACYDLRKQEVLKTITQVGAKIETPIDVGDVMFMTEINVITSLLWGGSSSMCDAAKLEFRQVLSNMTVLAGKPNLSDFFPMIAKFDVQGVVKEMKRLFHWIEKIFDDIIERRMKDGLRKDEVDKERKDLLQCLLELNEQEDTSTHVTHEQIKALLIDIIIGGTDTTTTMAEWAMAELMRNPDIMKKAQQEISEIVGANNIVEESHLPELHYLEAVLKEAFRLHPAIPFLVPKCPSASSIVGGYSIPKGTSVWVNLWAMHRDPEIWENPDEFRPDRFLGDKDMSKWDYTGNNFEYIPFGSGRRVCPGIPLAEKMLKYVLASLLHMFDWRLPEGEEVDFSAIIGIVMKKRIPLIAIPSRRSNLSEVYAQ